MEKEIHYCRSIRTKSLDFFFQKGRGVGNRLLLLGESLGRNRWIESGKPFATTEGKIAPTGKRLEEELAILDLTVEDCAFTEVAKCFIANNRKVLKSCGRRCGEHLISQLKKHKIKLVLSLGVVTRDILEELFDTKLSMGEVNQVSIEAQDFTVLPLYHPSPASPHGHSRNLIILAHNKNKIKRSLTKKSNS